VSDNRKYDRAAREWLHKEHPDVPCWRCARCQGIGVSACTCRDDNGSIMVIPYNAEHNSCMFVWDVEAAAREARSRLGFMGYESLPPMVKDVYNILDSSLSYQAKLDRENAR